MLKSSFGDGIRKLTPCEVFLKAIGSLSLQVKKKKVLNILKVKKYIFSPNTSSIYFEVVQLVL